VLLSNPLPHPRILVLLPWLQPPSAALLPSSLTKANEEVTFGGMGVGSCGH